MAENWRQANPANNPGPRADFAMCYDGANDQVVLWGGYDGTSVYDETWLWDGTDWAQAFPATNPGISGTFGGLANCMTYDVANGNVVLVKNNGKYCGTADSGGPWLQETWIWDGTNWTQVSPANPTPSFWGQGLCFDAANNVVVMYGGEYMQFCAPSRNTYTWDGTDWTVAATTRGSASSGIGFCYDANNGEVFQYAGDAADCVNDYNVSWVWNGTTWTQQFPASNPGERAMLYMEYAPSCSKVVMYGGVKFGDAYKSDTWLWDGTDWTELVPDVSPYARSTGGGTCVASQGMCRNVSTGDGDFIMYGGYTFTGSSVYIDETWLFSCAGFSPIPPGDRDPFINAEFSTV